MSDSKKPLAVYTKFEVAELLRVKVSWVERRAARRRIPFTMLGGEYRFTDEHVAEILRLNESAPVVGEFEPARPEPSRRRRRSMAPAAPVTAAVPLRARTVNRPRRQSA